MPNLMHKVVGDLIYDPGVRRDSRTNRSEEVFSVSKVSRKYLTAVPVNSRISSGIQVDRETGRLKADYDAFVLYDSKEQYEDSVLCKKLTKQIVSCFGHWGDTPPENVSSKQLQTVLDILKG
ncbi:hypothetical protein PHYNN_160 [Pantoea phage Phynn]|nr:hypothetical protein PHYNN_160 [Pantoea phage Phynn]